MRWFAASERMDSFFALVLKFLREEAVSVEGAKMEI